MTVCVAAICEGTSVMGASDRMLTAGDVQFEPQQSKILALSSSIAVMIAGDSSLQVEILGNVQAEIRARTQTKTSMPLEVFDVAAMYGKYCNEARLKRSENAILVPMGLDRDAFI